MSIGTQDRPRLVAAVISMALALLLTTHWLLGSESTVSAAPMDRAKGAISAAPAKKKIRQLDSLDPTLHYAQLELTESERYEGSGRNIFRSYSNEASKDNRRDQEPKPSHRQDPPAAPTLPLKFFGLAKTLSAERKACLTQDGDVFIGGEGDIIDRRYRIVHIGANTVDLEDLMDNRAHTLTLEQ